MLLNRAQPLWLVCVSAVLLSGLGIARAEEKPCTTHADGNYYDLNRLKSSNDYEFKSYGGKDYILNVCRPVRQEVWAPKVDKPEDVAGFTHRSHGDFSLGDVNTTVVVHGGHPLIYMTDGTRCPNAGDMTASTVIRFVCDASAGTGKPQLIATLPPDEEQACSFFVEWRSEIACPTAEGSVFGTIVSVLAIIVAVLFALYIVGGTLYNRYVLELQGMDQIPRFSFFSFSDTVEFVRECMERVRDKSSDAWQSRNWGTQDWGRGGSWSSSGRQGYGGLHASAEEAQTMLSGPPGFLDEQDEEDEEAPVPPAHPENGRAPGMDANGQQPQQMHDDQSQNFVASQYAMYPPPSEDDTGYLVYSQMSTYPGVVQQHPGPPPRQMSESEMQQAMQYHRQIHMIPGQHFAPTAPGSPNMYDPLSPPISGSDTSGDGLAYHSRNSSTTGSPSSSRANSLVHRHPLRYNPTPSPTSSSAGRRSRGHSISDDDIPPSMGGVNMAESLANTRKEATRRQRIEAEQRRRDELRDGYARLKDVLPVSNQKSSKVSLLERATNHIVNLEKTNRQLQARLASLEAEVSRLRALNEKISLGVNNTPSPGHVNMDSRPLSPPPEGSQSSSGQHQLATVEPIAESSPSASESGY
ncbi:hypothetical protein L227DRAFT_494428 [Lentinus tigrinus ALCF2SS1-6]|uniref:Uncharacterized protein n=1 Tax=Lentinus tigrinus ALCF2SS1-6 TaxID=1328759 RepID=A0A5C2SN17_9APHY|nr:hypothetical protein L227DRAFT_494428 [Lentinus tigrinus ALCF2SS1-6]